MPKIIRHGDVLLIPHKSLPADCHKESTKIVAKGEATGHHHSLQGSAAIYSSNSARYVSVNSSNVILTHQEHKPVQMEEGIYEIKIQRELDLMGQIRKVLD